MEKFAAAREMVVVWWMVFRAVTLHAPVVPAGQSTVNVLLKQTDVRYLRSERWMREMTE
jgi:hypothetical protein